MQLTALRPIVPAFVRAYFHGSWGRGLRPGVGGGPPGEGGNHAHYCRIQGSATRSLLPAGGFIADRVAGYGSRGGSAAIRWLVSGAAQKGATARTFTPTAADVGRLLSCSVTLTNSSGSVTGTSASVKVAIGAALAVVRNPVLSGPHKAGKAEAVSTGAWSPAATSVHLPVVPRHRQDRARDVVVLHAAHHRQGQEAALRRHGAPGRLRQRDPCHARCDARLTGRRGPAPPAWPGRHSPRPTGMVAVTLSVVGTSQPLPPSPGCSAEQARSRPR